jgi:hypothetical protein
MLLPSRLKLVLIKLIAGEYVVHISRTRLWTESFEETKRLSGCGFGGGPFIMAERNEVQRPAVRLELKREPTIPLKIDSRV